jgi:hypothetical protein
VAGRRRTLDPEKLAHPDDPEDAVDPAYLALLRDHDVRAFDNIGEFQRAIVDRIQEALTPPRPSLKVERGSGFLVLVHADEGDRLLADEVGKELVRRDIDAIKPLTSGNPTAIRKDFEQKLEDCDALMVVFGRAEVTWVSKQLLQARKVLSQRDQPPQVIAVYEGPPGSGVEDFGFTLARVPFRFLRYPPGGGDGRIDEFVDVLCGGLAV